MGSCLAVLYIATGHQEYKAYIAGANNVGGVRQSLGWDDKFVGAQALVAKVNVPDDPSIGLMKRQQLLASGTDDYTGHSAAHPPREAAQQRPPRRDEEQRGELPLQRRSAR